MKLSQLQVAILFSFSTLMGCTSSFESNPESTVTLPEEAYCGTPVSISGGGLTVTGDAEFKSRVTTKSGLVWYLDYTFNTTPIRNAEFHIYNSSGSLIQCGETASDGTFTAQVPSTSNQQYTIKIYSRAFNSVYKVSVLNDVNNNLPYTISKSFSVATAAPGDIGTLTAEGDDLVDPYIVGGAFNILNNVYLVNEFLRTTSSTVGFTVAPKVTIFWKAGFNPNTYRGGEALQGISYYIPGAYQLYIQGGINGDVISSDTDHFDDSIIIHEYGHFLEDVYGKTDSPGGSHNGDAIIDARLAWSEGWANYLQSAVKTSISSVAASSSVYIDTKGYRQSAGDASGFGSLTVFNMTDDPTQGSTYDRPNLASEGLFREVSISRSLYKTTSPATVTYIYNNTGPAKACVAVPFKYVWSAFTDGTNDYPGLHSDTRRFRSMGMFSSVFRSILSASADSAKVASWDTMMGEEKQPLNNLEYGAVLASSGSACLKSMTPTRNLESGTFVGTLTSNEDVYASNQLASNDFYTYYFDGSSNPTITIAYTQPGSPTVDLNMHAYVEDYVYFEDVYAVFGESSPYIVKSTSSAVGTNNTSKSISLAGKPAGYYLINVKAKTTNSDGSDKITAEVNGTLSYQLSNNGGLLCPQTP